VPSVRIWFRKQLRVDHLNFRQFEMLKLGTVGLAAVKNRLAAGLGPTDAPAKPLSKRDAIYKSKRLRRRAVRDLTLTGSMLGNLSVRTVSERAAKAALTSRKERIKDAAPGAYALLFVRAAAFPEPPARGDEVTVGGSVYKVVDLEADTEGGLRLVLHFSRAW
jgi:hypothetical protein